MSTFRQTLRSRFGVLGIAILVVVGVLLVRVWTIQVLNGAAYATLSEENRIREVALDAPRGRILDRAGRPLVVNRASLAVFLSPSEGENEPLVERLAELLGVETAEIEERMTSVREEPLKPRMIASDVPMEIVAYLAEHAAALPGVSVEPVPVRLYPEGDLGAHVLGYTGEISEERIEDEGFEDYLLGDLVGKSGAELEFESVLRGEAGFVRHEVDARGDPRRTVERREPIPGRDVVLTIDSEAQKVAEVALADAITEAHRQDFPNARAGAVVAVDIATGEILAMASAPSYDPELFIGGIGTEDWERLNDEDSEYPLHNRAIMSGYPPASIFKVVTGLAGLEEGVAKQYGTYYCPGKWTEMGEQWPKYCWKRSGHGGIDFMSGMEQSCDTVFYEIGYEFYKREGERLQAYARRFGLGEKTGVDLPGEVPGRVPDAAWKLEFNEDYPEYQKWLPGDTVNMAIGQGDMLATPLQMVTVFSAVANDGQLMRPHVLKEVLGPEGEVAVSFEPEVSHPPAASARNLEIIEDALVGVTEDGTAKEVFQGFEATVAGKTGTAQVKGKDDYAWFVGYAPAEDPRYAVAVVVEEGGSGGGVAGPAVRTILAHLLDLPIEEVRATDLSR